MITIGFLFWLLMILWLIFGVPWGDFRVPERGWRGPTNGLLFFALLFLLGLAQFGFPIKG